MAVDADPRDPAWPPTATRPTRRARGSAAGCRCRPRPSPTGPDTTGRRARFVDLRRAASSSAPASDAPVRARPRSACSRWRRAAATAAAERTTRVRRSDPGPSTMAPPPSRRPPRPRRRIRATAAAGEQVHRLPGRSALPPAQGRQAARRRRLALSPPGSAGTSDSCHSPWRAGSGRHSGSRNGPDASSARIAAKGSVTKTAPVGVTGSIRAALETSLP